MSELKHVKDRVVISIDLNYKNWHTFSDGTKIARLRQFNELNRRITEPVNAIVVSAENIPTGSEILIHVNEIHDSNKIFNYSPLSGNEAASTIKYYSVNEYQCFIYKEKDTSRWLPLKNFATGLRVFKPYTGNIAGIKPLQIKDCLYITAQKSLEGLVVNTLRSADYEIIFQNEKCQEQRIIRCRHYEELHDREEIIAINYDLTEQVNDEKLLIGLSISDCQTLNQYQCQQLTI